MAKEGGAEPQDPIKAAKQAYEEALKKLGRANIAVIGNAGVGKSTLINAMFGFNIAKTGVGQAVTKEIAYYEHPSGAIGLYDTKGIEVGDSKQHIIDGFEKLVRQGRSKPSSEQIHLVWYCLRATSMRFVDADAEIVRALAALGLPVVVVLTQVARRGGRLHPSTEELAGSIAERDLPIHPVGRPVPVMALRDDFEDLGAHGLEELLDVTFRVAPEGVHRALTAAQQIDFERKRSAAQVYVLAAAGSAGAAGAVPIPFADAALLVPIQIGMFAGITVGYGVPVDKGSFASLAGAAISFGGLTNAGKYIATSLLKMVPGGNVAAGVIRASVAASLTTAAGEAWIVVCERLARMDADQVAAMDSSEIKRLFTEAFERRVKAQPAS